MDLVEIGWGDVDWIGLPQDRDRWESSCEFGYATKLVASRVVLSSIELVMYLKIVPKQRTLFVVTVTFQ
jgi:hypothetical protein